MSVQFRPAVRVDTPLIVGLAGPTKSGKTFSAHRLARGMANGGQVAMINSEGKRGHQYADQFDYVAYDLLPPYSPKRYTEAIQGVADLKPAVLIIDSGSHLHDGPGGMLEYHDAELDRMAGEDYKKRQQSTWTAWIKPKAEENEFVYKLLALDIPTIICFRAKEKLKIVPGKQPIDLGWQPIASERVSFETIFTLVLPPHSKGVPDLSLSEMRDPFDKIVRGDVQIDEDLGKILADWSRGKSDAVKARDALDIEALRRAGEFAAIRGGAVLDEWIRSLSAAEKGAIKPFGAALRQKANEFDGAQAAQSDGEPV